MFASEVALCLCRGGREATLDQTSASVHTAERSPTPAFIHPPQRTCIECRTCVSCLQRRAGLCPENTPESSENETVTLLNTQWTRCVNSRHTFPHSTSLLFLSFLFFLISLSSFPPPWVIVRTQTLQPRQNINTLLMPSHSNSPESWREEKNVKGRWSWRQIQTLIVLVRD